MLSFKNTNLALIFLLSSIVVAEAAENKMIYKNQRGSVLAITRHELTSNVGSLTGSFTTAVGNCATDMNVPVPITGYFNGNAIAISANFPNCKQVVSMTGNLSADNNELHTLWLNAAWAPDPKGKDWNANIVGADSYKRIE